MGSVIARLAEANDSAFFSLLIYVNDEMRFSLDSYTFKGRRPCLECSWYYCKFCSRARSCRLGYKVQVFAVERDVMAAVNIYIWVWMCKYMRLCFQL